LMIEDMMTDTVCVALLYNALEIFSDADSIDTVFILHTQRVDNLTNTTSYFMHYFNLDSQIPRQCTHFFHTTLCNSDSFIHFFTPIHLLSCNWVLKCEGAGESSPDTSFSDYETWNPTSK
jgi:hypothetical protein